MAWRPKAGLLIEGHRLSSNSKNWRGTVLESPIPPLGEGSFGLTVKGGLVRLGLCSATADVDQLGTELQSFGYGGTGKKSHGGNFQDYGESFGVGDHMLCHVSRNAQGLSISYSKNGVALGTAFQLQADQLGELGQVDIFMAVCGKSFIVDLDVAKTPGSQMLSVEWPQELFYYALLKRGPSNGNGKVSKAEVDPETLLREFFQQNADANRPGHSDAVMTWLGGNGNRADFRGSKEVRRVQRSHGLPSGVTLTIIDSQPASKAGADRSYARNVALWESLPRGHAEIRHEDAIVCEMAGLRKFGSAEEKFGPLARGHGARKCALQTLPGALASVGDTSELKLVFMTKENGEMCKVSFFLLGSTPYLALGSKNVTLVVSVAAKDIAAKDLASYEEERYQFAVEMAEVFLDQLFDLTSLVRLEMIDWVAAKQATLCGESISPMHQHIQSYRDTTGNIQAHIRFFSMTSPTPFHLGGLTLVDPLEASRLFSSWGLSSVETIEEVAVGDHDAVQNMEKKHLLLPNREGAVVYVVLSKNAETRTALVYKWKNAWYVTVRALREKFSKRVSEARIRSRIALLHVHHPDEKNILEDFLSFYCFVLLLLPENDFDQLGSCWVALKAAHDAFQAGSRHWSDPLPESMISKWPCRWLEIFPKLYAKLKARMPETERWIEVLRQRKMFTLPSEVSESWVEEAVEGLLNQVALMGRPAAVPAAPAELLTLTAVLVRGLQGSGKSTLCRALAHLTQGEWINQDEVAAGAKRGSNAKELFLKAVSTAAGQPNVRYLFIDKIHTLKQHRDDVVTAVMQGFQGREGRVAVVLLNLCHPEDDEGDYLEAAKWCTRRIQSRGLGHLSLLPQAVDAEAVVVGAAEDAEVLTDEEKCSFELCCDLDLRLPRQLLLSEAVDRLKEGNFLSNNFSINEDRLEEAMKTSQDHELKLSSRWKTLYWMISVDWQFLWQAEAQDLRVALMEAIDSAAVSAINEPHVTLAWLGSEDHPELDEQIGHFEGSEVQLTVDAVCYDPSGLIALRVTLPHPCAAFCQNQYPHITVAKGPGVAAKQSNELLERVAKNENGVVEKVLAKSLHITGVVQRQLASESLAAAAASGAQLPEGNPICELGLAATEAAVDVWVTHESTIRVRKVDRILSSLLCPVSQPLMHCKGWPPALHGKKWFTFHEQPLSGESRLALETLQRSGAFATLHAAVAYLQVKDLHHFSLEALKQHLCERLCGRGVEALRCAAAVLREATESLSFYVQCKSAGSKEETIVFRQALAAAVAELMSWTPEIKTPQLTLSAHVKDDWILLGFVFPKPAEKAEAVAKKAKVSVAPVASVPEGKEVAVSLPEVKDGVLYIDGATLEGGGQLLRNGMAYAVTLHRPICIHNVRGGRSPPGLRPSHLAALNVLARLSGAPLHNAVGDAHVSWTPGDKGVQWGMVEVDAGTGGSTMLMLQALLPLMLATSGREGGQWLEMVFKGGTNVCSPPGRAFEINAPQVDYVQMVLFPVLRQLFGIKLEMEVKQRGFLQGGGEVLVRCACLTWPLPAVEILHPGEILEVAGTVYRSAAVPQCVLGRMLEGQMKKRPGGAAVLLRERFPKIVPQWRCEDCPSANNGDACGVVVALRTSTGCCFGGDSMGRKGTMAEAVGEEAARSALTAYNRGGCCDEHLEDQLVVLMALAKGTSRLRLGKKQSLHFQTALWLAQGFGAKVQVVADAEGEILEIQGLG